MEFTEADAAKANARRAAMFRHSTRDELLRSLKWLTPLLVWMGVEWWRQQNRQPPLVTPRLLMIGVLAAILAMLCQIWRTLDAIQRQGAPPRSGSSR